MISATTTLLLMPKTPTKEEIISTIVNEYFGDLEFIETLNNLTYGRKVQLKQNLKNEKT